ncbi:MAG: hypothetical protein WAT46_09715, partial [Saprospiraceae bacterium]
GIMHRLHFSGLKRQKLALAWVSCGQCRIEWRNNIRRPESYRVGTETKGGYLCPGAGRQCSVGLN